MAAQRDKISPAIERPNKGDWRQQQGRVFLDRYSDWLETRAKLEQLDGEDADATANFEAIHADLSQRLDDTARLAITTPAYDAFMVWRKFEILEAAIYKDEADPRWTDFRHLWMLAAIKADIAALGIGRCRQARV